MAVSLCYDCISLCSVSDLINEYSSSSSWCCVVCKAQRSYRANSYVIPSDKKRKTLRWQIRMDLAQGVKPPSAFDWFNCQSALVLTHPGLVNYSSKPFIISDNMWIVIHWEIPLCWAVFIFYSCARYFLKNIIRYKMMILPKKYSEDKKCSKMKTLLKSFLKILDSVFKVRFGRYFCINLLISTFVHLT